MVGACFEVLGAVVGACFEVLGAVVGACFEVVGAVVGACFEVVGAVVGACFEAGVASRCGARLSRSSTRTRVVSLVAMPVRGLL